MKKVKYIRIWQSKALSKDESEALLEQEGYEKHLYCIVNNILLEITKFTDGSRIFRKAEGLPSYYIEKAYKGS